MNETQLIEALRSGALERQVAALDEASRRVDELSDAAVRSLRESKGRFAIASRLSMFGPCLILKLEALLNQQIDEETTVHASVLLVQFGSRAGVPHLLSKLELDSEHAQGAVIALGKARIREAALPLRRMLQMLDASTDPYAKRTFSLALANVEAADE